MIGGHTSVTRTIKTLLVFAAPPQSLNAATRKRDTSRMKVLLRLMLLQIEIHGIGGVLSFSHTSKFQSFADTENT